MASIFGITKKLIFISASLFCFNAITLNAHAHWATHEHPTMWANVTHGVEHRQIFQGTEHKKKYHHEKFSLSKRKNYPFKNFWRKMKNYRFPTIGKYSLDYCFKQNHFCGRAAANSFCERQGYQYASQYKIDRHATLTRNIGDNKINHYPPNRGNGFTYIRCRKHA